MNTPVPSIFRSEALQHYRQKREAAVLPRLLRPNRFIFLWLLLAILLTVTGFAWFMPVPIYTSAQAIIVDTQTGRMPVDQETRLVIFAPAQQLSKLQTGQRLSMVLATAANPVPATIIAIEATPVSPAAVQQRFKLHSPAVQAINQPVVVAFASFSASPALLSPSAYRGAIYRVEIEIGAQRLLSFLPWGSQLVKGR